MSTTIKDIRSKLPAEVVAAIEKYFPAYAVEEALAIAFEESKGDTNAVRKNGEGNIDLGVFQINTKWHSEVNDIDAHNVDANVKMASEIWIERGWKEWAPSSLERVRKYLPTINVDPGSKRTIPTSNEAAINEVKAEEAKTSLFKPLQKDFNKSKLGSFNLDTFNFGIKSPELKLEQPAFNNLISSVTGRTATPNPVDAGLSDYEKEIQANQAIGTGLELGKIGANLATYIRNTKTEAPEALKAGTIPLLNRTFLNADYSQIDQDLIRMLGQSREGGAINLNPLLRASTDAKLKLGATTTAANLSEKARVESTNIGIMEKNIANKLSTDEYNQKLNLGLGAAKGAAQTSLMQAMFDNATNIVAYRQKASAEKEEYRRALADEKTRSNAALYGIL